MAKKLVDAQSQWSPDLSDVEEALSRDELRLTVTLGIEDTDGRCVWSESGFHISGGKRGLSGVWCRYHGPPLPQRYEESVELIQATYRVGVPDITDRINQVLGRDPTLRPLWRDAWAGLIDAAIRAGHDSDEARLVRLPLTVELDEDVQRELDRLSSEA